jgi:hypothetical protein
MDSLKKALASAQEQIGIERQFVIGPLYERDFDRFEQCFTPPAPRRAAGDHGTNLDRTAPPLYLTSVMEWGAGLSEAELSADGSSRDVIAGVHLGPLRIMGGGQEVEFHAPVAAGMVLVVSTCLESAEVKRGTEGPLLILKVRRTYCTESGDSLVTCRETFIAR